MPTADDLMRQAHKLSDAIRLKRTGLRPHDARGTGELLVLESQLREVWTAIRAARAPVPVFDEPQSSRRTYPKWR